MTDHTNQANCLRALTMDAVQHANSGHPGMPMGMADIATVLWQKHLCHNPSDPKWINRDRFILSNGHGSMLQYALLHLSGYDLSINDLRNFRQLHSKTPGHPEFGHTPGVETTTGPLGQGLANGVGMALAERMLANQFNQPDHTIIDHFTYVFAGDGCLMEGVSHEASALAGTWALGKLIVFYDDNNISIDGEVSPWFNENVAQRYLAYGWHVIESIDGHDPEAINMAIEQAKQDSRPSLLCCKTIIGWGSPNVAGSAKSHGAPLGEEEIKRVRQAINWSHPPFVIPNELYNSWDAKQRGQTKQHAWQVRYNHYRQTHPELANELERRTRGDLPENFEKIQAHWLQSAAQLKAMATRQSSKAWLEQAQADLPELIGGSADLSGSNGTLWKNASIQSPNNPTGRYIHYGVREFGMTAIINGIALYGGFVPYGGTFLVFSDYARNAIRLAALMKLRAIMVYTHDSVALGEDGPTHQPIEHLVALRAIPNLKVWRPADAVETAAAWIAALQYQGPSALVLTRQTLPNLNIKHTANIQRGAHVVYASGQRCDAVVIATGSEVQLAVQAAEQLAEQSIQVQVVSMPCVKQFLKQDKTYQDQILRPDVATRCAVEALSGDTWYRFVNHPDQIIAIDEFGVSAKGEDALAYFDISVTAIINRIHILLNNAVTMN